VPFVKDPSSFFFRPTHDNMDSIAPVEDWCFFTRLLGGIDPFDGSQWGAFIPGLNKLVSKYVMAPEFTPTYFDWINSISTCRLTSNILFLWDVDGLTRWFIMLKLFGRYGIYLPELIIFGWIVYLLVTKNTTAKIFNLFLATLQLCAVLTLITLFLPFAPAELFTGYKADGYSALVKMIFLVLSIFYFSAASTWELRGEIKKEIYTITLFFFLFSLALISCSNFWIFFFSLEGVSFCTIIFFLFNFSGQGNISDAVRYFCLNCIASGAFLLSLGLGEYVTNTADYNEFENFFLLNSNIIAVPNSFSLAMILFLIGSLFKLGIFPFNVYEVDTYKKSSYIVIYFASVVAKVPFFFVWMKLMWRVIPFAKSIFPILFALGLLTAVIGTFGALFQTVLRPFLTYSSMGHIGLILMSFSTETMLGVDCAFLYFLTYITAMSIIYMILIAFEAMDLDFHGLHQLRELRVNFSVACCFTLGVLTLAGFPLTIGFFAKVGLLINLASIGQVWIVVLILILNLISFGYYLRVLKIIWIEVNDVGALKYVLTDIKKTQNVVMERTFFIVKILCVALVISVFCIIFTFQLIIALTSTLYCVALYSVDWLFFVRHSLSEVKLWFLYFMDRDEDFRRDIQALDKVRHDVINPTFFKPKPGYERAWDFVNSRRLYAMLWKHRAKQSHIDWVENHLKNGPEN